MASTILVLLGAALIIGFVRCTDCPDFWTGFEGSCYLFPDHHQSSFTEAENYCRQHHNAHLVHIDSQAENTFVKTYLQKFKDEPHWMGLSDEDIEGYFKWYDTDTKLGYADWARGQPDNNIGGNEDCVVFYDDDDFTWHDFPCTEHFDPVCELKTEEFGGVDIIGR